MNNDRNIDTYKIYSYLTGYASSSSIAEEFPTKNLPEFPHPNKKIEDLEKIIFNTKSNQLVLPDEINLHIFESIDPKTRLSILPKVCQQFYLLNHSFSNQCFHLNEIFPKVLSVAKNCIYDTIGTKWFAIEFTGPKKLMFHKINVAAHHAIQDKYGIFQDSSFNAFMKYNRKFFQTTLESCLTESKNHEFNVLDLCEKACIEAGKEFKIYLSEFSISDVLKCNILAQKSDEIKIYHSFISFFELLSEGTLQGIALNLMNFKEIILMGADYTLLECKVELLSSLTEDELKKLEPLIHVFEEFFHLPFNSGLSTLNTSEEGCSVVLHKYFKDFILYMTDSSYEDCLSKTKNLLQELCEIYRFKSPFKSHLFFLYHCKELELFCPHGEINKKHQWFADSLIEKLTTK